MPTTKYRTRVERPKSDTRTYDAKGRPSTEPRALHTERARRKRAAAREPAPEVAQRTVREQEAEEAEGGDRASE